MAPVASRRRCHNADSEGDVDRRRSRVMAVVEEEANGDGHARPAAPNMGKSKSRRRAATATRSTPNAPVTDGLSTILTKLVDFPNSPVEANSSSGPTVDQERQVALNLAVSLPDKALLRIFAFVSAGDLFSLRLQSRRFNQLITQHRRCLPKFQLSDICLARRKLVTLTESVDYLGVSFDRQRGGRPRRISEIVAEPDEWPAFDAPQMAACVSQVLLSGFLTVDKVAITDALLSRLCSIEADCCVDQLRLVCCELNCSEALMRRFLGKVRPKSVHVLRCKFGNCECVSDGVLGAMSAVDVLEVYCDDWNRLPRITDKTLCHISARDRWPKTVDFTRVTSSITANGVASLIKMWQLAPSAAIDPGPVRYHYNLGSFRCTTAQFHREMQGLPVELLFNDVRRTVIIQAAHPSLPTTTLELNFCLC